MCATKGEDSFNKTHDFWSSSSSSSSTPQVTVTSSIVSKQPALGGYGHGGVDRKTSVNCECCGKEATELLRQQTCFDHRISMYPDLTSQTDKSIVRRTSDTDQSIGYVKNQSMIPANQFSIYRDLPISWHEYQEGDMCARTASPLKKGSILGRPGSVIHDGGRVTQCVGNLTSDLGRGGNCHGATTLGSGTGMKSSARRCTQVATSSSSVEDANLKLSVYDKSVCAETKPIRCLDVVRGYEGKQDLFERKNRDKRTYQVVRVSPPLPPTVGLLPKDHKLINHGCNWVMDTMEGGPQRRIADPQVGVRPAFEGSRTAPRVSMEGSSWTGTHKQQPPGHIIIYGEMNRA